MANIVSVLMPKPKAASTAKVPSSTTGTASVGISVARRFCRNSSITRKTSTIASSSVITTLVDRVLHEGRGVVRDREVQARRKVRLELGESRAHGLRRSRAHWRRMAA